MTPVAHGLGWPGEPDYGGAAPGGPAAHGRAGASAGRAGAGEPPGAAGQAMPPEDAGFEEAAAGDEWGGSITPAGPDVFSWQVARGLGWPGTLVSRGTWTHRGAARVAVGREAAMDVPAGETQASPAPVADFGAADRGLGESEGDAVVPVVTDPGSDMPIARAARAALAARTGSPVWPRPSACRIVTVANQKGGVGKTTTAVNLAASMSLHGLRVLVIDLDPQGNASTALDIDHHSGVVSIYDVLVDGQPLASVIRSAPSVPQLHCAPATIDLAGAEIELVPLVARESRLVRALAGFDSSGLDYIFIDCPPSLGLLTVNALVAAPEVLIPIQCEYYALEGLEQLLRTVDLVRSHLNPVLSVSTILLTMFDGRTRLASQVAQEVREHFGEIVLGAIIPRSVRVSEAPSYGQSVLTYDPGSTGAQAYVEAAREIAHRTAPSQV